MRGVAAVVSGVCVVLGLGSRVLDAQTLDAGKGPGPVSVHVSAGLTVPHADEDRGDVQSFSIGYSPTPKLMVLMGAWRMHRPTSVRHFSDGVTSFTRGGTTQIISAEVRFLFRPLERVAPYAFTGGGFGFSRSNVDDVFPDRVKHGNYPVFGGGGLSVPLSPRVSVSGDFGLFLLGEYDIMRPVLPVRVGLAWRF